MGREGGGHDLRNARGDSLPNLNQGANLWSGGRHTVTGRWIHQKMVSFKLYKFAPKGVLPTRPQYRTERGRSCREQQRDDHHYDNDYVESPLTEVCLLHPLIERASNAPAAIRFLPDASLISSDR